jgi:hypothetical protein
MLISSSAVQDFLNTYEHHANCYIKKPVDLDQFSAVENPSRHSGSRQCNYLRTRRRPLSSESIRTDQETYSFLNRTSVMSATQTWSGRVTARPSTRFGYRGNGWLLSAVRARRAGAAAQSPISRISRRTRWALNRRPWRRSITVRRWYPEVVHCPANSLKAFPHRPVLTRPKFVGEAALRHAQDRAAHPDRGITPQGQDHFPFLIEAPVSRIEAVFGSPSRA